MPILLGINSPQYTEEQLRAFREDNAEGITYEGRHYTGYEATQKQRQLERAQRKQKRRILVADTTGDAVSKQTAQIRLQMLNQHYKAFSKAAGLPLQEERVWVAGFNSAKHSINEIDRWNLRAHKLNQKNRGCKVAITDVAIQKVQKVKIKDFDSKTIETVHSAHRKLLQYAKDNNNSDEVAALLDITTGEQLPFVKGDQVSVNIEADADSYHWLRTKPERSIVLMHNHPGQSYFSMNDLSVFFHYPQLETMTIVTNQGKVWWIKKTDRYNFGALQRTLRNAQQRSGGDIDKLVALFLGECYNYGVERGG